MRAMLKENNLKKPQNAWYDPALTKDQRDFEKNSRISMPEPPPVAHFFRFEIHARSYARSQ